ncbi:hypothetical protein CANCADRAFT_42505 [Tortispora caseinolytica NRRL Y-17796]|uniref:Guanine nucleotide-binding protein alpha-2 subunit n=1 Tax=Tortispora caseinolytica NRRL Y-17796 TaxID=767744 RepID=A0A1E4TJF5_9ASCO|nr:hypothetical protein CANCADRAFT_42505 [Tortispora caseinolytica NRRL Y-17796]
MGSCMSSHKEDQPRTAPNAPQAAPPKDSGTASEPDASPVAKKLPEYKVLLLGTGESGKSTILKQMKILHQHGYSQEERALYRPSIFKNVLDCAKTLATAMKTFEIEPQQQEVDLDFILDAQIDADPNIPLDSLLANKIKLMWTDPAMATVLDRRNEFYLMDSAAYFMDAIDRIAEPNYLPTTDDVLRARIKTTGIYESSFVTGDMILKMIDVGGQRSERKKWISSFENVTSVIFCVALSEYDQVLLEESNQNRMFESFVLFDSVINSQWFTRSSIILFLNKIDVFTEKLKRSPLEHYFPDYTGGDDPNRAAKYILWRFTRLNRSNASIYPHITQATDTNNFRVVFATVRETILQNALKDSGII